MQKKVFILFALILLIALVSCSKETKKEQNLDEAKQKIKEINKLAENAIYHTVYSISQGSKVAEMEAWQKQDKVKTKVVATVNNKQLITISLINEDGVFVCQSSGEEPLVCLKLAEIQNKYAKDTMKAFRDEVLEKANCFLAKSKDKFQEICYTTKGVMVYTKHNTKGELVEINAKSIDYSVDDSQFKLEGKLIEQK
jgi:outer membrane lipoprotein-sorting protein